MKVFKKNFDTSLGFVDLLNFGVMITPNIMLGKDGSLTSGYTYECWDYENADNAELNDLSEVINTAFLRLGSEYAVHFRARRKETLNYTDASHSHFSCVTTQLIEEEKREKFQRSGSHYATQLAFTITYLPESVNKAKLVDFFVNATSGQTQKKSRTDRNVYLFQTQLQEVELQLGACMKLKRMGVYEESGFKFNALLEYIVSCINDDNRHVLHPENQFLDGVIATEDFTTEPFLKVGGKYINVVSIDSYPATSYMGILQSLDKVPCEYHWVNRACFLDAMDAEKHIDKYRKGWQQKVRGFTDQIMGRHTGNENLDAVEMKNDAQEAKSENNSGLFRFLFFTSTVVLFHEDKDILDETTRMVRETIRNAVHFNARLETINAVEAYIGTLPSHIDENVRKPIIHTGNMSHLIPSSTTWTGEEYSPCPFFPEKSPPLMTVSSTGASVFKLNLHESDVGHCFLNGKTGAGKSTLVCAVAAQFDRYPDSQVFCLDKGRSAKVFCKLSGGQYYDILSGENTVNFSPLERINEKSEFLWALDWLQSIVKINGYDMQPEQITKLNEALKIVAQMDNADGQYRNMDALVTKVQDKDLKAIFEQYASGGAYGEILNQPSENITIGKFTVFEYGDLLDRDAKIKLPVIFYLSRLIERQLDGRPTLVTIDEAWKFLGEDTAKTRVLQWLREWRKSNASVLLSTQNAHSIIAAGEDIFSEIAQAVSSVLFTYNPDAEGTARRANEILGCKPAEMRRIRRLIPKSEYFIKKGDNRRTFSLDLAEGDIALSILGASSQDDIRRIDELEEEAKDTYDLLFKWFEYKGVNLDYANRLFKKVQEDNQHA